jgi:hypothetical protein
MRLTVKERQSVIAVMQERYRKAGKKLITFGSSA